MAYQSITERNLSKGFQEIFIYVNDVSNGLFSQLLLFAIWTITTFSLFMANYRRTGDMSEGDFPLCATVGSFITIISAILLRLIAGMLDGLTLTITIIIGSIFVLWFSFSRK